MTHRTWYPLRQDPANQRLSKLKEWYDREVQSLHLSSLIEGRLSIQDHPIIDKAWGSLLLMTSSKLGGWWEHAWVILYAETFLEACHLFDKFKVMGEIMPIVKVKRNSGQLEVVTEEYASERDKQAEEKEMERAKKEAEKEGKPEEWYTFVKDENKGEYDYLDSMGMYYMTAQDNRNVGYHNQLVFFVKLADDNANDLPPCHLRVKIEIKQQLISCYYRKDNYRTIHKYPEYSFMRASYISWGGSDDSLGHYYLYWNNTEHPLDALHTNIRKELEGKEEPFDLNEWQFPVPPVTTAYWTDKDWELWIKRNGRKITQESV